MLSLSQLATLKTDIQSRPTLWSNGTQQISNEDVALFYNSTATPAVSLWRPVVSIQELNSAIVWADVVLIPIEKQLAYQSMIWANSIDMTDPQVRNGIDAIFGNGTVSRNNIFSVGKRNATYLEALFSTGTVTKVSQLFSYQLNPAEVSAAING